MDCLFCKIAHGEISSAKIYEDDTVVAFLDIIPNTPGHTLVIPKKHFENVFDIDDITLEKVFVTGKKIAHQVTEKLGAMGVHLANNNGFHASQVVPHFHLHIIPRYENDGLTMYGPRHDKKAEPEALNLIAQKLFFS